MAKKPSTKTQSAKPQATRTPAPLERKTKPPVVEAHATACPACGSTERVPYFNVRERAIAGVTPGGRPFTHVVWRRTRCTPCGQTRDDKTFELRVRAQPPASKKRKAA
jgi:hypothetical protein